MSDISDKASEIEQLQRELALKRHQNKRQVSSPYCVDCGDDIPPARLQAIQGCCRCVSCQQIYEQQARNYR